MYIYVIKYLCAWWERKDRDMCGLISMIIFTHCTGLCSGATRMGEKKLYKNKWINSHKIDGYTLEGGHWASEKIKIHMNSNKNGITSLTSTR